MKYLIYIFAITLTLSSCFKEEDKREPLKTQVKSIKLESDYSVQHFYKLSDTSIVSSNNWTKWDLKFYAQNNNYYVKLNDAANMKAFNTNSKNFESVKTFNNTWISKVDNPEGDLNLLALDLEFISNGSDTLFTNKNVYVLLLGTDAAGNEIGYKKIVIDYFYGNHYHIRFANLDGSEEFEAIIAKDETLNYVYFSLNNQGEIVTVEPDRNTWDLVFTRSTDITIKNDFTDTIFDYSVTGVILNPYSTQAYQIIDENFASTNKDNVNSLDFTNQLNAIGYNWKSYDLENSVYAVRKNNYYIIKDGNSLVYKLKFISFVDPVTNNRGTISFEYEVLK